jgi:hypothetical protein
MLHFVLGYLRDLVIGTGFPLAERRPCYSTLPTKIQNGYGMAHLSNLLWEATELVHSVMPPNSAEAIDLRTCEHHPSWASVLNGPRSIFNSHLHLRYVANTLHHQPPVPACNGLCPHSRFQLLRRSTSGRLLWTTRESNAWTGFRVELAPETKFYPSPHFQQREWFTTTLVQHPPQKWCDLLQYIYAYLM